MLTVQQDALGRLHTNGLEQLRVAQGQLHKFTNLHMASGLQRQCEVQHAQKQHAAPS